ncbi:hypothetical protein ACPZ19_05190 [Amycolatopsis lurida]
MPRRLGHQQRVLNGARDLDPGPRDLIKLADIADALTRALEHRSVEPGEARFIIDVAIAISRRATSRWLADPDATLSELIAQAADELCEAVTPRAR